VGFIEHKSSKRSTPTIGSASPSTCKQLMYSLGVQKIIGKMPAWYQ